MQRKSLVMVFVIAFGIAFYVAYYIQGFYAAGVERLTIWLIFSELVGFGGLIFIELSTFLWNSPLPESG